MADNIVLPGTGSTVAVDDIAGIGWQRIKLADGTADSTAMIGGDSTNGLDVDVTRLPGAFAEDSAHGSGDFGHQVLTVRSDVPAATSGSSGDYQPPVTGANGELWVGLVGNNTTTVIEVDSSGLTIATTSYISGDQLGAEFTFPNAVRISGGKAILEGVVLINNATQLGAVDLFLFDSTSGSAGDNNPNSWTDPNMRKCVGVVQLVPTASSANNQVMSWSGGLPVWCAATSLFGVLVTRSAHTFFTASTGATDIRLKLFLRRE